MASLEKLAKLIDRLEGMQQEVERLNDARIYQRIGMHQYQNDARELKHTICRILSLRAQEQQMLSIAEEKYRTLFQLWKSDIRWIQQFKSNTNRQTVL